MSKHITMRFPEGKAKVLTLSYDDGVRQDLRLMDILDRYGIKATFNLNAGLYAVEGGHRRMTAEEITAAYADRGHEVACHGYTHPFLESLPATAVADEILSDRKALEAQFGHIIRGMAYPYGTFSDEVVAVLRACGIVYARTTVSTEKFELPTDWLRLPATCHHKNPRLMELAKSFVELYVGSRPPKLFYLWGHSYEFDDANNWHVIEEFAAYMGGHADAVWFATNIEVYEYIEDYKRLRTSADGRIVHNPTARTLWFECNKELCAILPGQTLTLPKA